MGLHGLPCAGTPARKHAVALCVAGWSLPTFARLQTFQCVWVEGVAYITTDWLASNGWTPAFQLCRRAWTAAF